MVDPLLLRDLAILVRVEGLYELIHLRVMLLAVRLNSDMACLSEQLRASQRSTFVLIELVVELLSLLPGEFPTLSDLHSLKHRQSTCIIALTFLKDLFKDAVLV